MLDPGAQEFIDLQNDALNDVGTVDLVFDVFGGDIGKRSAALIRAGGIVVTIAGPPEARPVNGLAVDFVVESDRAQLTAIVQRVRDGRLRTNIGTVSTLDDAVADLNRTERRIGKTIIRVRPCATRAHRCEMHDCGEIIIEAIVVTDQAAGTAGKKLVEEPAL
ncbi:NADPH:quinone reductase-like Zn-dependent oxidoreductase [Bradyrhizobium ottawaense]